MTNILTYILIKLFQQQKTKWNTIMFNGTNYSFYRLFKWTFIHTYTLCMNFYYERRYISLLLNCSLAFIIFISFSFLTFFLQSLDFWNWQSYKLRLNNDNIWNFDSYGQWLLLIIENEWFLHFDWFSLLTNLRYEKCIPIQVVWISNICSWNCICLRKVEI